MSAAKIPHQRPIRSGNNSTVGERVTEKIRQGIGQFFGGRRVAAVMGVIVGAVIIAGAILWYFNSYTSPSRTFWGMINNNLRTASVTREASQKTATGTNNEATQLSFNPSNPSPMVRDVKEISSSNKTSSADVKIESLGTPNDTYQHYAYLSQSAPNAVKPNFSGVYPLWIKNGGQGQKSSSSLFVNSIFSTFLFGNLPTGERNHLVSDLHNAYRINYDTVKSQSQHGHRIYVYYVTLSLKDYAKAAEYYAKVLHLKQAQQINPNNYKPSDQVTLSVSVDVIARQLKQIEYSATKASEQYEAYGESVRYQIPTHTVSYGDLQAAVSKATKTSK